ncbi:MAG: nucleotide sugar dehydrogenase [Candidatus Aminicenantes bacterium]|nr:nucleotide sugar dehydrogenase [Candidatus Aminicenantes bacterium]
MKEEIKIGIVGLWHLGCVLSAAWSKLGFKVIGFDYSMNLINNLNQIQPPIYEPNLKETLKLSIDKKKLIFSNNIEQLKDCNFVFLAHDTPVLDNDKSDLSPLQRSINDLGIILKDGAVVVVSSQTPVGTCQRFRNQLQETNPTVELVYSPENLRLGEAIECYLSPGRIIIGADSEIAISKATNLFNKIQAEIITMNIPSAEMVKHAINAFLANSIVFANHLSDLCATTGANVLEVIKGVKTDPRIGKKSYLSPGIGFSGGTLGRDLQVLSDTNKNSRQKAFLFESILKFNTDRINVIFDKVTDLLNGELSKKIISVLGLTYKPGTSTLRRSLPLEIVELIAQKGAILKVYDPKANYEELDKDPPFKICTSIDEAISKSHLIILLTEWNEFKEYDWKKGLALTKNKKIFDTKNFLYDLGLSKMGYYYSGIGF